MLPAPAEQATDDEKGITAVNRPLNSRQAFFVRLVLDGKSHSEAYRIAYSKPDAKPKAAADHAFALSVRPNVALALKATRYDQPYHRLLTKEDILKVCAGIMMSETASRHERLRAAQVYASIAGYIPREMESLLNVGSDGGLSETGPLRITVNIFQNAPSRIRNAIPVAATTLTENGNGRH